MGLMRYLFGDKKPSRGDILKLAFLALAFFLAIGGYTIAKELKDSIFVNIVGREYMPIAKILSMIVLVPMVFLYARLVDVLRRYQLLSFYAIFYGIASFVCVYFLGHPVIGLANTDASPYRYFGWIFYFLIEGYSPFVVSVMWAFTNSVTDPQEAKNTYPFLTAASKLGGAVTAGFAWAFLSWTGSEGFAMMSDVRVHQLLLLVSSAFLLAIPFVITLIMKNVPGYLMHGYEAVYKQEKKLAKEAKKEKKRRGPIAWIKSMLSGIALLIERPYVLGMFGMIFFWELVNVVFQYMRLGVGQAATNSVTGFSVFLYKQIFIVLLIGFLFSLIGTRLIVKWLGERRGLMLVPLSIGALMVYYLWAQTAVAVSVVYIGMRIINYALAYPLRESLYLPTTKEIKFKSKSWIDGFGTKLSKSIGSYYNIVSSAFAGVALMQMHVIFFALVIFLWTTLAHFLGKRFERAINNDEVIGAE